MVLSVTFDHNLWLLRLGQSSFKLAITSNARNREHLEAFANSCKHYKINEHSRNTSVVLSVTFDHYHWLLRLGQFSFKLAITSNARNRENLEAFANSCKHYKINEHSRNSSGVLSLSFDHYLWLLRLGQSSFKLAITSNARNREHLEAFAISCKHYKINEHSRNSSVVLSVTFDHYLWLLRFGQSSFKLTVTSNARNRENLYAFAHSCKDYKINEHSRNSSGVLSVTFDHYLWLLRFKPKIIFDYFGLVNVYLNLPLLRTRAIVNT